MKNNNVYFNGLDNKKVDCLTCFFCWYDCDKGRKSCSKKDHWCTVSDCDNSLIGIYLDNSNRVHTCNDWSPIHKQKVDSEEFLVFPEDCKRD